MTTLDLILAIISFLSFGFAIFSYIKTKINKVIDKANLEIYKERYKALHQELELIFYSADSIVQIPKKRDNVDIQELQDKARVLRGQIFLLSKNLKKTRNNLEKYQFGKMIKSAPIDGSFIEKDK